MPEQRTRRAAVVVSKKGGVLAELPVVVVAAAGVGPTRLRKFRVVSRKVASVVVAARVSEYF